MFIIALLAICKFFYIIIQHCTALKCIGYYSSFKGCSERDGLLRLVSAFKLETTGHSGTDYYKRIETEILTATFKTGRSINNLLTTLRGNEKTSRPCS